jgi:glutamine amidotransferase PdxT
MAVGILALQGAFAEHGQILDRLGVEHFEIRQLRDLEKKPDRFILPGGESTVMNKLLHELGLFEPIKKMKEMQVDYLQGYYFGRPCRKEQFIQQYTAVSE